MEVDGLVEAQILVKSEVRCGDGHVLVHLLLRHRPITQLVFDMALRGDDGTTDHLQQGALAAAVGAE